MNGKFLLLGQERLENSFVRFVDRKTREQRRYERRLAEQRTTKHQIDARKSCIADSRSYRIAREFPLSIAAQLDWKPLNPAHRFSIFGSDSLKKFRENQLKHWLAAKQAS